MRKLYSAYNEVEEFTALVMAENDAAAKKLINGYSKDAKLSSEWYLMPTTIENVKDELFDCDYLIQGPEFEPDGVVFLENVREFLFNRKWEQRIIIATETDVFDIINHMMIMEVAEGVDFEQAAMLASTEYCLTEEGKEIYAGNCNNFNWGDFNTYVPNTICEKYGIRKTDGMAVCEGVSFDQQLVNEQEIFPEG